MSEAKILGRAQSNTALQLQTKRQQKPVLQGFASQKHLLEIRALIGEDVRNAVTTVYRATVNKVKEVFHTARTGYNYVKQYVASSQQQKQQMRREAANYVKEKVNSYAKKHFPTAYEKAKQFGKSTYNCTNLKEAGNIYHSWTKSMEKTVKHFCTTANRIKNDAVEFLKNVDWKKVAITGAAIGLSTLAAFVTGGLAAPAIGAALGSGLGAAVVTGVVTGVIGGAVYGTTYSGLSGNDAKTVLKDTLVGAGTGALTGGAMGAVGYGIQSLLNRGTSAVSTAGTSAKNTVSGIAE